MATALESWSVRAVNLPEHANNPIHTDAGARAAGYPAALVAGVTVYAYLTHPPAAAWGLQWLKRGGGELRLRQPVLDEETVHCNILDQDGIQTVAAVCDEQIRASVEVWQSVEAPPMRPGDDLETLSMELDDALATYGTRCGDDLTLYAEQGIAHPALWPNVANMVFTDQMVSGPWIHTRSRIYHQDIVRTGDKLRIESTVIKRFSTRAGERAIVDMQIFSNEKVAARIEHEALVSLNDA